MRKGIIRVLTVDDSPSMCKVIANMLNLDPQILVSGVVQNGKNAVDIVASLKPDIITMDIHMPVMDGVEATKQIMAYTPTPILILSNSIFKEGMGKVFQAISYGALDVMDKGELDLAGDRKGSEQLVEKIKFLSDIKVIRHPLAKIEKEADLSLPKISKDKGLSSIVAIAASTGGPKSICQILKNFPKDFPCGIVAVQHIATGFVEGLVKWLDGECNIQVRIAKDSEEIQPGVAYIAPCGVHMRVEEGGKIQLVNAPPYNGFRPSGDILLSSVGKIYGEDAIGIILTGMGKDGVDGMKTIKQMNGKTIAQDENSCTVFGMPKVAIEMEIIDAVLPLDKIAQKIIGLLAKK
jgi:two-component system chemotaxis response regulator CheB